MFGSFQVLLIWALAVCLLPASSGLRIAEDDAGWIPALYGNGQGPRLGVLFAFPVPSQALGVFCMSTFTNDLANAQWLAKNAPTETEREAARRHADAILALVASLIPDSSTRP